ncbi:MAG: hypothetical protein E7313_06190 [Clostridiales bacterium]|nr:hypothetical protein [Clostridiales bacterium]
MTEAELKYFAINYINEKLKENENYIRYTYFELKVKNNLLDEEIEKFLEINKNYFKNKGYKVYFTDDRFEYENAKRKVEINELMIAIKDNEKEVENGRKITKARHKQVKFK